MKNNGHPIQPLPNPSPQSKAPATRLKRFAHAAFEEAEADGAYQVSAAIRKAGNLTDENLKNAERDLHGLFQRYGLTVPVPISSLKCGLFHVHYFSLWSWFNFLMADYSNLLLGGFRFGDPLAGLLLESFWKMYRVAHGDHWVFQEHSERLRQCVPYYLHLDEGTGLRKSAVLVINMQACWGQGTSDEFEKLHTSGLGRRDADMEDYMLRAAFQNQRGSSLESRFLYTLIPKKMYTKKNHFVYDKVLKTLATESRKLASEGIGGTFPICLGMKGDAPALAKAGHYTRSFQKLTWLDLAKNICFIQTTFQVLNDTMGAHQTTMVVFKSHQTRSFQNMSDNFS